jgi:hypothetical protein
MPDGIVLAGHVFPIPGVECKPYRQLAHVSTRRQPVRAIYVHTSTGERVDVVTGTGPDASAEALGAYFADTTRTASADYAVDADSIAVLNDPLRFFTWHASQVNPTSIGIELTVPGGRLDTRTLRNCLALCDVLTGALGIQRQVPWVAGQPYSGLLTRATTAGGAGASLFGLFGHDNAAERGERGSEDSPDVVWQWMREAGYEGFDFNAGEDRATWRPRQDALGVPADGLPGALTVGALERAGRACGIWVPRPYGCVLSTGTVPLQTPPSVAPAPDPEQPNPGATPVPSGGGNAGLWVAGAVAVGTAAWLWQRGSRRRPARR